MASADPDPSQLFTPHPTITLTNIRGHCLCASITFTLHGPIMYHTLCSCANCRRATGSLIGCETLLPTSTLTILTGQDVLKSYEDKTTESGVPMTRQFCGECGSQLFAHTPLLEGVVSVFAGSWVRDAGEWEPMREQFCSANIVGEWMKLPKDVIRTVTNPLSDVVEDDKK